MKKAAFIQKNALRLRNTMTDAERVVWSLLRNRRISCKFRRQQPIDHYIADFLCFELRLIIEVDGGQHTPEKDAIRTQYLQQQGFRILRFWNNDVLENKEGVYQTILDEIENTPHPG